MLHTENGDVSYQYAWNEQFPYGTFAFGNSEMNVAESGEGNRLTIPVYRLGGTEGRATVLVEYTPAATELEDGSVSYAYAASAKTDLKLSVEDPQPIAAYQKLGQAPVSPP